MKFIDKLKQKLIPKEWRDPAVMEQRMRDFAQMVEAADGMSDPAERLATAQKAKQDVEQYAEYLGRRMRSKADDIDGVIFGVSTGGGVAAGLAAGFALNPALGGLIFLGGYLLGMGNMITGISRRGMQKFLERTNAGTIEQVDTLYTRASDIARTTLEANTVAIAASPKFSQLYDDFPEIRDHFIKTFNQAAARGELPLPPSPPAPERKDSFKL